MIVGCSRLFVITLALCLMWSSLEAQDDTRTGEIAAAQAAKAQQLRPYVPNRFEQVGDRLRERVFEVPGGPHLWLDSVYSGGGFTLGGGYRQFVSDRTAWDARGMVSLKGYTRFEADLAARGLSQGRLDMRALAGWRDATQVSFYGVGADTSADARTNFRLQQVYVGADTRARGPAATVFDLGAYYEDFTLKEGTGSTPSIGEVHTPATAPGLGDNPSFMHLTGRGAFDWRPAEGYARRGGAYGATYEAYLDPDDIYTFDTLQVDAVQHFPILRETWVLSFRGAARTVLRDDDVVPYFLLPSLGSGSTLRAYPSWRFRDRHSLLFSGEWRWIPSRMFLDLALFADAGKVTSRREDLNFSDLTTDIGVGIRFHSPQQTPLRIDVAKGREGLNIVFSGAAAF